MANVLNVLTKAYTESHRRYHTLEHIAHMFNVARDHNISLSEVQIQAIWWHDAVYIPCSKNNENDSIDLMRQHTERDIVQIETIRIIIDTMHDYKIPIYNMESAVVCDLDMFGFVDSIEKHVSINKQIKEEFMLAGVSSDEYRRGRLKFLKNLLDRQIFYSDHFMKYNELAQARVAADIASIEYE